ncbi:MAG: hypothetical protein R2816_03265 [Flavobacteriaceae bacterium]|nr:hypothetical protein [Flavobacteriaceae bacterium]
MVKNTNWLNHFIEFAVVLSGILLAFQLDKCSSNRYQKEVVQSHFNEILEETRFNKRFLESTIQISKKHLGIIDSTLTLISDKGDISTINKNALEILNISQLYTRKNAFTSFVESGDIRFVKDFYKKRKIIDLYEYYKWVEAFDESALRVFTEDYYPYMRDNFDFKNGSLQHRDIYFSQTFVNGLAAMRLTSKNKLEKYKDCLAEVNDFLKDFHEK